MFYVERKNIEQLVGRNVLYKKLTNNQANNMSVKKVLNQSSSSSALNNSNRSSVLVLKMEIRKALLFKF